MTADLAALVERLEALAKKATPGPWRQHLVDDTTVIAPDRSEICTTWPEGGIDDNVDFNTDTERHEANAAYLAACDPQSILRLCDAGPAALERFAKKLEEQTDEHVHERWSYDPSTGSWETRNQASEDWVSDRRELIEEMRAEAAALRAVSARP